MAVREKVKETGLLKWLHSFFYGYDGYDLACCLYTMWIKKRCYFQVEILKAKQVPSFEFAPATQLRKSNEHLSYSDVYLKEVNCTGKLRHQNRKLNAIISQWNIQNLCKTT